MNLIEAIVVLLSRRTISSIIRTRVETMIPKAVKKEWIKSESNLKKMLTPIKITDNGYSRDKYTLKLEV